MAAGAPGTTEGGGTFRLEELAPFREGTGQHQMATLGVEGTGQEQMLLQSLGSRGTRRNTFPYVDLALLSQF
jgi:hypothetical protein